MYKTPCCRPSCRFMDDFSFLTIKAENNDDIVNVTSNDIAEDDEYVDYDYDWCITGFGLIFKIMKMVL